MISELGEVSHRFAVSDDVEFFLDDSLAYANDDDGFRLLVVVESGGRFWELIVIVRSA